MLANYGEALLSGVNVPVWKMLVNSTIMALGITFGKIVISLLSAFAIVYFRFPGKMLFFWAIFLTLMLPVEVRIVPTYEVVANFGMLNSYSGLILPLVASATATFLFRQFFLTVPDELAEAARVDGASPMRFFIDILLPMSRTNIAALFVILFIYGWNQYLWPLLVTTDPGNEHHRHGHPADVPLGRRSGELAGHHGDRDDGHAAAGSGGPVHAEPVHQGPDGDGEIMATVTLKDVRKSFGKTEVIHGVDAHVEDGEFIVIVGPSGCGKSTLLRMVAGLETVTSGAVSIDGRVVNDLEPMDRDIAMVFQNYALYPHMTVRANMAYGLKIAKVPKPQIEERVAQASAMLQLDPYLDRLPRQLSGGQRQRVAMGRAIVREPSVFLFDEPLSNLDAKLRVAMRLEIRELQSRLGITSLYVTHDQVEAMTLADRMIVMNEGRAEQIGRPLDVYQNPATTFVASFIGSPPMNLFDPSTVSVDSDQGAMTAGVRPEHVRIVPGANRPGSTTPVNGHGRPGPRSSSGRSRRRPGTSGSRRTGRTGRPRVG